jgi:hypothetical protein
MPPLSRRAFLAWLAAAVPAGALVRRAHAAAVDALAADARTLHALGEAVLPSELGAAGIASAVRDFQRWIAGYREGAELLHGYGTSRLAHSGPTPATRWAAQLDRLDAAARAGHGQAFAELPLAERRALVRDALADVRGDRLPPVGRAPHAAVALLAHWYGGADATDRCYEARVGRQSCRPLAAQARRPLPLARARA